MFYREGTAAWPRSAAIGLLLPLIHRTGAPDAFADRSRASLGAGAVRVRPLPAAAEEGRAGNMSVPIITIHSDKGGVAKSTTAVTLVDYFAREGRKVLAVDCDPGGEVEGLTMMRGTLAADDSATTYGLISHGDRVVMRDGMALVPADRDDLDSLNEDSGGAALTDLRDRLQEEAARLGFDVVVIDTATGSSTFLTLSAILAATHVVVPTEASFLTVGGLQSSFDTLFEIASSPVADPALADNLGVLITRFRASTLVHAQYKERIAEFCADNGVKLFSEVIKEDTRVEQAQGKGISIFDLPGPLNKAKAQYKWFCDELAEWVGLGKKEA